MARSETSQHSASFVEWSRQGRWGFSYRRGNSGDVIHAALMENGSLVLQVNGQRGFHSELRG
jgi:hypothetical protein